MSLTVGSLVYATCICVLFYIVHPRLRLGLLVVSSLAYIFYLDRYAGVALLITSLLAWAFGMLTDRASDHEQYRLSRVLMIIGVALSTAAIILMKYVTPVLQGLDSDCVLARFVIPLGFSYYIFQVISYLVDVQSGRVHADASLIRVIFYLSWFPKFLSGPIERKADMDKRIAQIETVSLIDGARWVSVVHYLLIGCLYKIVMADRIGVYVDKIFELKSGLGSIWLFIGMILYTFQIYCDFAGYSYAAIGLSRAFGIDLSENFKTPYLSQNITEFWRRWHITLSNWLKDYIYIPLGGNRKGQVRKIINTIIVFAVCGMWHGESKNFLVWGLLHGLYSTIDSIAAGKGVKWFRTGVPGRIITFLCVAAAWVFFRAESAMSGIRYFVYMFTSGLRLRTFSTDYLVLFGERSPEIIVIIVSVAVLLIMEIYAYRTDRSVPGIWIDRPYVIRYGVVAIGVLIILIFGLYGAGYDNQRMIYMQF